MAVVGEANIIVRAITTGFDNDLRQQLKRIGGAALPDARVGGESIGQAFTRGFNAGSGNIFQKVSSGLQQLAPDAEQARLAFRSLVRTSYVVGTGLTALVGGIAALVGGLIALVAAVGRAAPAIAGLASAFIQVRLAASFAQFALGGISQAVAAATKQNQGLGKSIAEIREEFQQLQFQAEEAALSEGRAALNLEKALENLRRTADLPPNSAARREAKLAYDEAELAYRKAKDRTQDLNAEVAKGPQALNQGGGSDPYAGLTESQKQFAQFLVGLRPKLDILKEAVASGFLPVLEAQIIKLDEQYFPLLEERLTEIGTALGTGAENIFDNFLDDSTKAEVDEFLANLRDNIPLIGEIIGEFAELFFRFFNDANGIGTKFLEFVRDSLTGWNEELEKNGLDSFFGDAFATGSRLFGIIGNIFNGLGDFFTILNDSGAIDSILDYLELLTGGFASLVDDQGNVSEEGRKLGETYKGLADNFGPVVTFLGQVFDSFLKIGANPNIGEFFKILSEEGNQQNWDNIFKAFADAAPNLALLITELGELFAAFADEGAPQLFFDTLRELIGPVTDFFTQNKEFIDLVTRGFAIVTAFTFFFEQLKNIFLVILGNVFAFVGAFLSAKGIFEFFKKNGPKIFGAIGNALKFVGSLLGTVFGIVGRVLGVFLKIGRFLVGGPIGLAISALILSLQFFFTQTEKGREIFAAFQNIVGTVVENIKSFFNTLWTNLTAGWDDFVESIKSFSIADVIKGMINGVIGFFEFLINEVLKSWNNGLLKNLNSLKVPDWVPLIGGRSLDIPPARLLKIPRLAEGGVVAPSVGGTIAQIAEAGKPERVEPLDDRGLSKRDYALIEALEKTGGGINITVNPSPGMDERELAAAVSRRLAFEIKKGTI